MNSKLIAVIIAVLVVSVSLFAIYQYLSVTDNNHPCIIVPEEPPFYGGKIDIQFLNPNGIHATKVLASLYVVYPNNPSIPENGSHFDRIVVRDYSGSNGIMPITVNGLMLNASEAWLSVRGRLNPGNHDGINESYILTGTEELSNNSEYTTITYLSYSPSYIKNNISIPFDLRYTVKLNTFVNNSVLPPPSLGEGDYHIPNTCTPGYFWEIQPNDSFSSSNLWFPISWVSNQTSNGQGSLASTSGYSNQILAFEVGAYNSFKGGWTSNLSAADTLSNYVNTESLQWGNYKSAAIFINASVYLQTFRWIYQSYYCHVTYYNDWDFQFSLQDIETSGSQIVMHYSYGYGNISSILPSIERGMPNYVYKTMTPFLNFSGSIPTMGGDSVHYSVLKVQIQNLADKLVGLLPVGPSGISILNTLAEVYGWAKTLVSNIAANLPYVGAILGGIQWQNVKVYSNEISIENPGPPQVFDVYTYQTIYNYNLSGWGSSTDQLLVSYYNVT
jgi:hypothetical protein